VLMIVRGLPRLSFTFVDAEETPISIPYRLSLEVTVLPSITTAPPATVSMFESPTVELGAELPVNTGIVPGVPPVVVTGVVCAIELDAAASSINTIAFVIPCIGSPF
jgi:hypothetical protein